MKAGNSTDDRRPSVTVLASLNKKIRVIKISEDPRALRVRPSPYNSSTKLMVIRRLTLQAVQYRYAETHLRAWLIRDRMHFSTLTDY